MFDTLIVVINRTDLIVQIVILVVVITSSYGVLKHKFVGLANRVVFIGILSLGVALVGGNSGQPFKLI